MTIGIVLEPLSPAGLSAVMITDGLLGIGRDSEPFSQLDAALVSGLAHRQGYVFCEQGKCFFIGIAGMTLRNAKAIPLQQPVELESGDTICFGDMLRYRVRVDAHLQVAASSLALQVSLIPTEDAESSDTLIVGSFPFLVSRESVAFLHHASRVPAAIKALSRRHAFLYVRNNKLYLVDLGSTNGTRIGQHRLTPYHEACLKSGDLITFGSRHLSYTVALLCSEPTVVAEHDPPTAVQRVGDTVYIRTANSFLDIFTDLPTDHQVADHIDSAKPSKSFIKKSTKFSALLAGLREAWRDDQPSETARRWIVPSGMALVVLAGVGSYYLYDTPQREIAGLLARQDYQTALQRAIDHRQRYPDTAILEELATEALSKGLLPIWINLIENKDFNAATVLLQESRNLTTSFPENERILDLLNWLTDLERFIVQRGGVHQPLVLFRDEETVVTLLQYWEANASSFDLLLLKLVQQVPEFQNRRSNALGQLRILRNDHAVYVSALTELRRSLDRQLAAGDSIAALQRLTEFEQQYPRVTGLTPLREDILRLQHLLEVLAKRDIETLIVQSDPEFTTPWIQDWAASTLQRPEPSTLETYRLARQDWLQGHTEQAILRLQGLVEHQDAQYIAAELAHFKHVTASMKVLIDARQQPDYGEQLLAFSRSLDPERDHYFLELFSADLADQQAALMAEIEPLLEQMERYWQAYREAGGINSLMRLDTTISDVFRAQSQHLREAYHAAETALHRYRLLGNAPPDAIQHVHQAILSEVMLQRRAFTELGLVLDPALIGSKLELLPHPE